MTGPVVHCLTNDVSRERVAAVLAAIGAIPVMAGAMEEVADVAAKSAALLLDCGTPTAERFAAMRAAAASAREAGVPIVLDPVGCGLSTWRTAQIRDLSRASPPALVRGNIAEVAALAGIAGPPLVGVTAAEAAPDEAARVARGASASLGMTVLATGRGADAVADGARLAQLRLDVPVLDRIVGAGDVLSALVAAELAIGAEPFVAAQGAHGRFAAAARAAGALGPGSFWPRFIDAVGAHD